MHVQAEWSIQLLGLVKYIWVCGSYIIVYCSDNNSSNHQKPISHRNVDLTVEDVARIDHFDLGEIAHIHHLGEKLESGRNDSLRGDDCGKNRDYKGWVKHSRWDCVKEGVTVGRGVVRNISCLANITQ